MAGIKRENSKVLCAVCDFEVNEKQNFCTNCGNPLRLDAAESKFNKDLMVVDKFILAVVNYAKENNCSVERAINDVRKAL